jgi:hypothetical protein
MTFAVVVLISGPIGTSGQGAGEERLAKGPVIQNVQTNRATISWITHRGAGQIRKAGEVEPVPIEEPQFHHVELQGLEPGTRYTYNLGRYGVEASFETAPAAGTPFAFVVYGDTRTRHEVHRRTVNRILEAKPNFVLHMGDLVANGLVSKDWDIFFDIEKELLRSIPFFPTLGNHERNAPFYYRIFCSPGAETDHYSFDWGDAHFATINSNQQGETPEEREAHLKTQADWLREDLRRNKKSLTFVYMHHPVYTAVERRQQSADRLRRQLEQVFVEGGVTAVFAGHDHNYQHHVQSGIHHVVSGGGGAPLYEVVPVPQVTVKAEKIENYVCVRVEGGKAQVKAFDLDGNLLETFEMQGRVPAE